MQIRTIPWRLVVAGPAVMLLSACASDLIITHKNAPGDQVRLMGQGDSFECNDPAYTEVKKVQSATLVFTDGTISLCRPADAVARRERNEGSAPRAPMAVGTGTASGADTEGAILGGSQRDSSTKSFGDRGL
jgi:hypothetical protein